MDSNSVSLAFVSHGSGFATKAKGKTKQKCSLGWNDNCYCSFSNLLGLESLFPSIALRVYRLRNF